MANKYIYELPQLFTLSGGLKIPAYDEVTNTTYHFDLSLLGFGGNPADYLWNDTDNFDEGEIVTWSQGPGQPLEVWVSESDGNVGNVPGPGSPFWSPGTTQRSGLVPWQAGIFMDDYPAVVHNDIIYWLDPSVPRPYNSVDIDAEILAGDWVPLGGAGGTFGTPGSIPRSNDTADGFSYDGVLSYYGGTLTIGDVSGPDMATGFMFNGGDGAYWQARVGDNVTFAAQYVSHDMLTDGSGAVIKARRVGDWTGTIEARPSDNVARIISYDELSGDTNYIEAYGAYTALSQSLGFASRSFGSLPDPTLFPEGIVLWCNDELTGKSLVYSDGVDWRRVSDNGVVNSASLSGFTNAGSGLTNFGGGRIDLGGSLSNDVGGSAPFDWNDGAGLSGYFNFGGNGVNYHEETLAGIGEFTHSQPLTAWRSEDTATGSKTEMFADDSGNFDFTFNVEGSFTGRISNTAIEEYLAMYIIDDVTSDAIGVYARKTGLDLTAQGLQISVDAPLVLEPYVAHAPVEGGIMYYDGGATPTIAVSDGVSWYNVTTGAVI